MLAVVVLCAAVHRGEGGLDGLRVVLELVEGLTL